MEYEVIVDNAQVLIAPGKNKLRPGLPLGYKLTSKRFDSGGVFFDPDGRYPYTEVWTALSNLKVVEDEPPAGDGLPAPIAAGEFVVSFDGVEYVNRDEIAWVKK